MATYLLNPQVSLAGASGFQAQGTQALNTLQVDVDFSQLKAITTAAAQTIGSASTAALNILAADTLKIANIPAGSCIRAAYLNVITAMTGGTSPTVTVTAAGNQVIAATSISATGITSNTGTAMKGGTATDCLHLPIAVSADGTVDLTFGGTLAVTGNGKIRVTIELIRL
jgi:hypothetical protein